MPKMKTRSSVKKRFTVNAAGKVKRKKANRSHILTKKTTKRKRQLRKGTYCSIVQEKKINAMMQQ